MLENFCRLAVIQILCFTLMRKLTQQKTGFFFENIITKKDLYHVVKEIKEMRYTMIRKLFKQSRP